MSSFDKDDFNFNFNFNAPMHVSYWNCGNSTWRKVLQKHYDLKDKTVPYGSWTFFSVTNPHRPYPYRELITLDRPLVGRLKYQWMKDGKVLPSFPENYYHGAITDVDTNTLRIARACKENNGLYECIIETPVGSVTKRARLQVVDPAIIRRPKTKRVVFGKDATFTVTAAGSGTLSFRWSKDNEIIQTDLHPYSKGDAHHLEDLEDDGGSIDNMFDLFDSVNSLDSEPYSDGEGVSDTLQICSVEEGYEGRYKCVVSNASGTVETEFAQLTVVYPPHITLQPCSQVVLSGEKLSFTVTAGGTEPFSYQWKRNGEIITRDDHRFCEGANTSTLCIDTVFSQYGGNYSCVVSNEAGNVESESAQLTVALPPQITTHPVDQTKWHGEEAEFTVSADGEGTLSYQWRKDGQDITEDSYVSSYCEGATTPVLRISSVLVKYKGKYSCVVTDENGQTVESESAQLGVVRQSVALLKPLSEDYLKHHPENKPQKTFVPLAPPKVEHVDVSSDREQVIKGHDDGIEIKIQPQVHAADQVKDACVQIQSLDPGSNTTVELPAGTKISSPIYSITKSESLNSAEASIKHFAHVDSSSDVKMLYSSNKCAPYVFEEVNSGGNVSVDAGIFPLDKSGCYAVGTSTDSPERLAVYLVHPFPYLTSECMCILFGVGYYHPAFENQLKDTMVEYHENTKFLVTSHLIKLLPDSDAVALVPTEELKALGYSLEPYGQSSLKISRSKITYKDYKDFRSPSLPPSVMLKLKANHTDHTDVMKFHLQVSGIEDNLSTLFSLEVEGPSQCLSPSPNPLDKVDGKKLNEFVSVGHLRSLLSYFAGNWKEIARGLQFTEQEIGLLEGNPNLKSKGPIAYLTAMLEEWMKWPEPSLDPDVKHVSYATFEMLESAFKQNKCSDLVAAGDVLKKNFLRVLQGLKPRYNKAETKYSEVSVVFDNEIVEVRYIEDYKTSARRQWKLENYDDMLTGESVVIAIIDSGINIEHEVFRVACEENRIKGRNFVPEEKDTDPDKWKHSEDPHGTMAAFVATGNGFTGKYSTDIEDLTHLTSPGGVAQRATLFICRVQTEKSPTLNWEAISCALEYLSDTRRMKNEHGINKVDIVSMSFGAPKSSSPSQDKVRGFIQKLRDNNVLLVASSGNYGLTHGCLHGSLFPACVKGVISVGALNKKGYPSNSNTLRKHIDVYAPGENIVTPSAHTDWAAVHNGSSCSAPAVAGLIALVKHCAKLRSNRDQQRKCCDYHYYKDCLFKTEMVPEKDASHYIDPSDYFLSILDPESYFTRFFTLLQKHCCCGSHASD